MKKFIAIIALCIGFTQVLFAKQRTPEDVLNLAKQKLNPLLQTRSIQSPQLVIIPSSQLFNKATTRSFVDDAFYIVSASNGFAIVSGDDRMLPIIGYSETGSIDVNRLPRHILAWLETYVAEYNYVKSNPQYAYSGSPTTRSSYPERIEPLINSVWGQDAPFYNMTPKVGNVQTKTGCVATTMAQLMYYHKYPLRGEGSHTYEDKINENSSRIVSLDFTNRPFVWDNMQDSYNNGYSLKNGDEVAHLMISCGVATSSHFGTDYSGSSHEALKVGLIDYFKYDPNTIRYHRRYQFNYATWTEMIRNEIRCSRPIAYGGTSAKLGGHSFIIDGYDENGLFHVNWGWDGGSNGFYALTTLDPTGSENSIRGFGNEQDMLIGIQKPVQSSSYKSSFNIMTSLKLTTSNLQIDRNATFSIGTTTLANHGEDFNGIIQLLLYNSDGTFVTALGSTPNTVPVLRYRGTSVTFSTIQIPTTLVPPGRYELHIGTKDNRESTWSKTLGELIYGTFYYVDITNTTITFSQDIDRDALTATDFTLLRDKIYKGMALPMKISLNNAGMEWYGRIGVQAVSTDNGGVDILLAEDRILYLKGNIEADLFTQLVELPVGNYKLIPSYSKNGVHWSPLKGGTEKNVTIYPTPQWDQYVLELKAGPTFTYEMIPSDQPIEFSISVRNTGIGPFDGVILARMFRKGQNGTIMEPSIRVFMEPNTEKVITFSNMHEFAKGEYSMRLIYDGGQLGQRQFVETLYYFTIGDPGSIPLEKDFMISPSPVDELLNIRTKAPTYGWRIESVGGHLQKENNTTSSAQEYNIPIADMHSGMYVLYVYRKPERQEPKKLKFVKK